MEKQNIFRILPYKIKIMKRLLLLSLGVILISCEKNDPLADLIDVYEEALTDTTNTTISIINLIWMVGVSKIIMVITI